MDYNFRNWTVASPFYKMHCRKLYISKTRTRIFGYKAREREREKEREREREREKERKREGGKCKKSRNCVM